MTTLFGSEVPGDVTLDDNTNYSLGIRFTPSVDGTITHLRRYFPDPLGDPPFTGALYRVSDSALLGSLTFGTTAAGWQEQAFGAPIAVVGGVMYEAIYWTSKKYVGTVSYPYPKVSGELTAGTANGWFNVGAANAFATGQSGNSANYFVDVVFEPEASDTTPVSNSVDLRWAVKSLVSQTVDLRWAVKSAVSQSVDLRWAVKSLVAGTTDLRWAVKSLVSNSVDLRWAVATTTSPVSNSVDLRWAVKSAVVSSVDLRWAVKSIVSSSVDLRWAVKTLVASSIDLRWSVRTQVSGTVDLRWAVSVGVSGSVALLWQVRNRVTGTVTLLWVSDGVAQIPLPADARAILTDHFAVRPELATIVSRPVDRILYR